MKVIQFPPKKRRRKVLRWNKERDARGYNPNKRSENSISFYSRSDELLNGDDNIYLTG